MAQHLICFTIYSMALIYWFNKYKIKEDQNKEGKINISEAR